MDANGVSCQVQLVDPAYLRGKRILMFVANFFDLHKQIVDALTALGAEVDFYDERPSNSFIAKGLIRVDPALMTMPTKRYYKRIVEKTKERNYDYIFFIKAECVPVSALKLLHRYHPDAKFVLYEWDSVIYYQKQFERIRMYFDKVLSFDRFDCKRYGMQFLPSFYDNAYANVAASDIRPVYDLLFVGTVHSDRYEFVNKVCRQLCDMGKSLYTYLYIQHKLIYLKNKYINRSIHDDTDVQWHYKPLSLEQLCCLYGQSRIILEIPRPKQRGLTFRAIEALGAHRKLITTNSDVVNYDFYDPDNILVVDRENPHIPKEFIEKPYKVLDKTIYRQYSIDNWLANMFA